MIGTNELFIIVVISISFMILIGLGIIALLMFYLNFIRSLNKDVNEIKQIIAKESENNLCYFEKHY